MPNSTTRKLLRRLAAAFAISFVSLTVLLLAIFAARQLPHLGAERSMASTVPQVLLFAVPFTAAITIPMAVFVAVLWVFTRLGAEGADWRLKALVRVYEEADHFADLNALAEVLIEIDECLALWRAHHIQMVERMIGAKRGTGGSAGVGYLATTLAKRAFPDLWTARTHIGEEPGA